MTKPKRRRPPRYWEHAAVTLDIHEATDVMALIRSADLTDSYTGACESIKQKLTRALDQMRPKADVCAACRHHKTHHGRKGRKWMKPPQVCSGNWPEQGPCRCRRFRRQA